MRNHPKVSIIVPIYRKEHSVEKCIKSIIAQDYKNKEIILVDDGSPDKCGIIIDGMADRYNFIKTIHQKNLGVSIARNNAVKCTDGEYVCYVDADDYMHKDYISTLVKEMEDDTDMIVSAAEDNCTQKSYYITRNDAIKKMFIDDYFGVCVWGKLFKKKMIPLDAFPEGVKMGEDMVALFKIINKCNKIKFIPYHGYFYTKEAIEGSFMHSDIFDYFKTIDLIDDMKYYIENNRKISRYLEIGKVRRYLGILNIIERKGIAEGTYSNRCLSKIKEFRKIYGYCEELTININMRILLATYLPEIYLKIVKRTMKK